MFARDRLAAAQARLAIDLDGQGIVELAAGARQYVVGPSGIAQQFGHAGRAGVLARGGALEHLCQGIGLVHYDRGRRRGCGPGWSRCRVRALRPRQTSRAGGQGKKDRKQFVSCSHAGKRCREPRQRVGSRGASGCVIARPGRPTGWHCTLGFAAVESHALLRSAAKRGPKSPRCRGIARPVITVARARSDVRLHHRRAACRVRGLLRYATITSLAAPAPLRR